MARYLGWRSLSGECVVMVDGAALDQRLDLYSHSPTGFEWGYGGSGPAQLALAILAHHLPNANDALALHQEFKWSWVFFFGPTWEMTSAQIEAWVQRKRQQIRSGYDARQN